MPKSWSKAKQIEMAGHECLKSPDADNIAKAVLDAANTLLYHDDRQISVLNVHKVWGGSDGCVILTIKWGE